MTSTAEYSIAEISPIHHALFSTNQRALNLDSQRAELKSLGLQLQKSLELDVVLRTFNHEVNARIPWCTVAFDNEEMNLHSRFGKIMPYQLSYRLEVEGQFLGNISFSKSDKFRKRETDLVENLLCIAIYPIRNALKYYRAIKFASTDTLTGLGNRFAYEQAIEREISIAHRHNSSFSLLIIDVDHFKAINDNFGHDAGDQVLAIIGQAIRLVARGSDLAFRYGGEEFVLLLSNTDMAGATLFAERVRSTIAALDYQSARLDKTMAISATVSVGVSSFRTSDSAQSLFKRADEALYEAKYSGRNRVVQGEGS